MMSTAQSIAQALVTELGEDGAQQVVEQFLDSQSVVDLTAHLHDWDFWCEPKQRIDGGAWLDHGFLSGRGLGKTIADSHFVNQEIRAGRAMSVGLAAQDEDNCIKIQVTGSDGLIATADPDFKPEWRVSDLELIYPNGARAYVRTPEVPGKIRGFNYHLSWLIEIQSWPASTRDEAWSNFELSTRLGYARILWEATPKKGHPLLKRLRAAAAADPKRHVIVSGTTYENPYLNLKTYIKNLEEKYSGTSKGREELLGEMLDESENALVKQAWIDSARRKAPEKLTRRIISVDPAITTRKGNDRTGIVDEGLGVDSQCYVFADHSGRHLPDEWARIVLDAYVTGGCDCVVVETNKGGDLVTQNLRADASSRGLQVVVLGKTERPRVQPGIVYIREVHARGEKADRAQPLATAYERGRVSHVVGSDLSSLEELLTTWEPVPGSRSPDALDALTHGTIELLGLMANKPDPKTAFVGITEVAKTLPGASFSAISNLLGGSGGDRI